MEYMIIYNLRHIVCELVTGIQCDIFKKHISALVRDPHGKVKSQKWHQCLPLNAKATKQFLLKHANVVVAFKPVTLRGKYDVYSHQQKNYDTTGKKN